MPSWSKSWPKSGTGDEEVLQKAAEGALGLFVRSLVDWDREAAKNAFSAFLVGEAMTATQIEFVNLVIDYLTEHGVMDPRMLYESPFTDMGPTGPDGVFGGDGVDMLLAILKGVRQAAFA